MITGLIIWLIGYLFTYAIHFADTIETKDNPKLLYDFIFPLGVLLLAWPVFLGLVSYELIEGKEDD